MFEVDKIRVLENLRVVDENLGYISEVKLENVKKEKENIRDYYFVSMSLFNILNKVLDLAEDLVDSLNVRKYPTKYIDFFKVLNSEGVIDDKLLIKMKSFVEYRNDIVHEYEHIQDMELVWCVKNISYIKDFLKIVKKRLL